MQRAVALILAVLLCRYPAKLAAQMPAMQSSIAHGGASAIPLLTWADRTAGDRALSEAYVTQPVAMGWISLGSFSAQGTLDFEGLTLKRGELSTGGWGEGFVDRRHPHSYLHEAMLGAMKLVGSTDLSLFAGRGFAPFGSDDPMMRPFVKYPANHHLAQILERIVAIGAAGYGPVIVELGAFNGDEPTSPASAPQWDRFGDSWSARLTLRPARPLEFSYSHAFVRSPESPQGGTFDQRKNHASARFVSSSGMLRYGLVEWALTDEVLHGARHFRYQSILGEGVTIVRDVSVAIRLEHSTRPEEERLADLFRTVHPVTDVSILGISQWNTITANVSAPPLALRPLRAVPFVEGSFSYVAHGSPAGLVDLTSLYGSRRLWMLSIGARLAIGHMHDRMGRYGVARAVSVLHASSM